METTSDLDGRAGPGAENGCTPTPDLTACGGASIVRLFALRDECLAASDFPSLTISAQGVGRPLAEAAAILDGKAAQVCESAGACDRRHAFLGLSAQQCIPALGEPCCPQVAHASHALEVAEMLNERTARDLRRGAEIGTRDRRIHVSLEVVDRTIDIASPRRRSRAVRSFNISATS